MPSESENKCPLEFKLDSKRVAVYTNSPHTVLGFCSYTLQYPGVILFTIGTKATNKECYSQYLIKVESLDQLASVENDLKKHIQTTQKSIEEYRLSIKDIEKNHEIVSKLKVNRSNKIAPDIIDKLHKDRDERSIVWPSFEDTEISPDSIVQFSRGVQPFFFNSEDVLLKFNIGDIVEVSFGKGSKTWKRYKGKKIKMVVNNCKQYKWRNESKKLALTPTEDGWLKSDIVFIDDTDRFECLMIDLFPVNRRPFSGWETKKVSINKVGHVSTLPIAAHSSIPPNPEDLFGSKPNDWVVHYEPPRSSASRWEYSHVALNVLMFKNVDPRSRSDVFKISTTTDKHLAIEFFEKQKTHSERKIEELEETLDYYQECLVFSQVAREQLFQPQT
jgi:hypothetical protein